MIRKKAAIMGKNIYVGNLPYDTTGDDLVELFQAYGTVTSGQVIIDGVQRPEPSGSASSRWRRTTRPWPPSRPWNVDPLRLAGR